MNESIDEQWEPQEPSDEATEGVRKLVEFIAGEQLALVAFKKLFDDRPARIWKSDAERKAIQERVFDLVERFGRPSHVHLMNRANDGSDDSNIERFDAYPAAALEEVGKLFERTLHTVCRAQLMLFGSHLLEENPNLFPDVQRSVHEGFVGILDSCFWEHAETAYIRMASYWDRVGQVLDFTFFSIRKYERDGFTTVMDRIYSNFIPMDATLSALPEWKALRTFQTSEKQDGLKWLLRRRNLLVHSLYLRPLTQSDSSTEDNEAVLFAAEFNHLEESLRKKLAPGSPLEEMERLYLQVQKAAELYPAMLGLCEYAVERR